MNEEDWPKSATHKHNSAASHCFNMKVMGIVLWIETHPENQTPFLYVLYQKIPSGATWNLQFNLINPECGAALFVTDARWYGGDESEDLPSFISGVVGHIIRFAFLHTLHRHSSRLFELRPFSRIPITAKQYIYRTRRTITDSNVNPHTCFVCISLSASEIHSRSGFERLNIVLRFASGSCWDLCGLRVFLFSFIYCERDDDNMLCLMMLRERRPSAALRSPHHRRRFAEYAIRFLSLSDAARYGLSPCSGEVCLFVHFICGSHFSRSKINVYVRTAKALYVHTCRHFIQANCPHQQRGKEHYVIAHIWSYPLVQIYIRSRFDVYICGE